MTDHIIKLISASEQLRAEGEQINAEMAKHSAEYDRLKAISNQLIELSYSLAKDRQHLADSVGMELSKLSGSD
jgi:recombinational DNA repair ATPase RecF